MTDRLCPYCSSLDSELVLTGYGIPSKSPRPTHSFNLVCCRQCRAMFVSPAPPRSELIEYYPLDYYAPAPTSHIWAIFERLNRMNSFLQRKTRQWISTDSRFLTRRVLEIGCATGRNLEPFLTAGWEAYAVEPNRRLASIARSKGIAVHVGFDDDAAWNDLKFEVVILHHVLEHDHDPRAMLSRAAEALSPGGQLFVEVPTFETPSWQLFRKYWGTLEFPVHLTLLRKWQVMALLKDVGCLPAEFKTRTLYGEVFRALNHRFPRIEEKRRMGSLTVTPLAVVIQIALAALNAVLRRGEAFTVVAEQKTRGPEPHVNPGLIRRPVQRRDAESELKPAGPLSCSWSSMRTCQDARREP